MRTLLRSLALAVTTAATACASVIGLDDLHRDGASHGSPGGATTTGNNAGDDTGGNQTDPATDGGVHVTGDPTCPGTAGPPGVRVTTPQGTFCIDATEVTNDDYAAFLATASDPASLLPDACDGHDDMRPTKDWPARAGAGKLPVGWVDWCDAYAFCAWAGKALCKDPGGSASNEGPPVAAAGQWSTACAGAKTKAFPYGDAYAPGTCNDGATGAVSAVATHPACVGGFSGLYDMSGNVAEWEDSCSDKHHDEDTCNVRGGGFDSAAGSPSLGCNGRTPQLRTSSAANIGFRCCSR